MTKKHNDNVLTEAEAALYLNVKPRTIRLWRVMRGLPHFKPTHKVTLYSREDLNAWLERHRTAYPPRVHRRSRVIPPAPVTCEARTNPVQSAAQGKEA
ncbi:MAG: helix-turn-helix domain-containing protein [Verrucomicrobiae bacterium]|nr:helix-turn-helix domain-containing protein [Verrucomicrobiae bacterium]